MLPIFVWAKKRTKALSPETCAHTQVILLICVIDWSIYDGYNDEANLSLRSIGTNVILFKGPPIVLFSNLVNDAVGRGLESRHQLKIEL